MTLACPKCRSGRIHRSRRRSVAEYLLHTAGFKSMRCHECNTRFAASGKSTVFPEDFARLLRKLSGAALLVVAILLVVGAVVWLSGRTETDSTAASATFLRAAVYSE